DAVPQDASRHDDFPTRSAIGRRQTTRWVTWGDEFAVAAVTITGTTIFGQRGTDDQVTTWSRSGHALATAWSRHDVFGLLDGRRHVGQQPGQVAVAVARLDVPAADLIGLAGGQRSPRRVLVEQGVGVGVGPRVDEDHVG